MDRGAGKTEKKRRVPGPTVLCFALICVLLAATVGVTLARYISATDSRGAAVAKPFYFSSDKLSDHSPVPYFQVEEPGDLEDVSFAFALRNYMDSVRCTDEDISYTYQAVSAVGDPLGQEISGVLSRGGEKSREISLTIPKSAFYKADGKAGVVTVTAWATSPYEKTISACLGFQEVQNSLQWSVSESENAVVLWLGGGAGEGVTIEWPPGLTPDLSNPQFSGATAQSVSFAAESGIRYALTFLKGDPSGSYTKENFTVTVG